MCLRGLGRPGWGTAPAEAGGSTNTTRGSSEQAESSARSRRSQEGHGHGHGPGPTPTGDSGPRVEGKPSRSMDKLSRSTDEAATVEAARGRVTDPGPEQVPSRTLPRSGPDVCLWMGASGTPSSPLQKADPDMAENTPPLRMGGRGPWQSCLVQSEK